MSHLSSFLSLRPAREYDAVRVNVRPIHSRGGGKTMFVPDTMQEFYDEVGIWIAIATVYQ